MGIGSNCIALVTQPTRLQGLVGRWSTKSAAKFRFKKFRAHENALRSQRAVTASEAVAMADEEADFDQYVEEDDNYQEVVRRLREALDFDLPVVVVEKEHLPNFMFMRAEVVVVVGQDGLVANTAKYAEGLPIVGVNPAPQRYDGVLLPFELGQARQAVRKVLDGKASSRNVTLAKVQLNDGQSMLAFNDFFIGRAGHSSARYTLRVDMDAEPQSSSGVLVSTGAGSTGWMSSVLNMAEAIARQCGSDITRPSKLDWEDRELVWAVREPFVSRHSQASLVFGTVAKNEEVVVESLMPERGVIFSDGIENDFLEFNSGTIARIQVADQQAQLVMPATMV